MRSHLPRNRSRSVHSSPSPSPPPSPHLRAQAGAASPSGQVIPSREKRRSFSTRQAVGSRPVPSRNPSSETRLSQHNAKPDDHKSWRRRESHNETRMRRSSHSKARPRLQIPVDSETMSFPGGLRSWPSYSTHAEASVSSAGGVEEDDRFSSSDTEVGDSRDSHEIIAIAASLEGSDLDHPSHEHRYTAVRSDLSLEASTTSRDTSPRARPLLLTQNSNGKHDHAMARSGSNGSESDASRLNFKERWWDVVREITRSAV